MLPPVADGTLVDGGGYGRFDGIADEWDWTFNESGYEGAITLSRSPAPILLEHRVIWEFSLAAVNTPLPVTARFTVLIRGAPRFPAEDSVVAVFAYPGDLLERAEDFAQGPTTLAGSTSLAPFQPPTYVTFDVGRIVNDALAAGQRNIGFRLQIDPNSSEATSQAFIDALDSEPSSKPVLTVDSAHPGDANRDSVVDFVDYELFTGCMTGPGGAPTLSCRAFDFDLDRDVDLADFDSFSYYLSYFTR